MSVSPLAPNPALDNAPIAHMFKSPRDVFAQIAEKSQQDPELMALAESVAVALDRYLAGELTLRDFARCHTPYERFRAVRAWGPLSPYFNPMMGVLDELIALHKTGKTPQRPERMGQQDWPIVAADGRHECAHCYREANMRRGAAQLCGACRISLQVV